MSFLRRLFAKKVEEDYETVLSNLADDIQKRQLHLSEIRLRERRSVLLVTLYALAAWMAYFVAWYLDALPRSKSTTTMERLLRGVPILVGPIVILFIRRIVQIWYTRKGDAEEKALKKLMKQRREKVEEIKKKTNYYSTRDLLQKYDESLPGTPALLRQRFPISQPGPATPQRPIPPQAKDDKQHALQTSPDANLQMSPVTLNHSVGPRRKQWYDRLADAILGDDDLVGASPSSRYALICEKCFTHNGLVKESMWEDARYICLKCGHFNQSARSKRQRTMSSPSGSVNSSPVSTTTPLRPNADHRRPSPPTSSPGTAISDLPTVDADESMSMVVDSAETKGSPVS